MTLNDPRYKKDNCGMENAGSLKATKYCQMYCSINTLYLTVKIPEGN